MDKTEFNVEGEIMKAKELILKLNEAAKSNIRQRELIEEETIFELHNRIDDAVKHQDQIDVFEALRFQILRLKQFPDAGFYLSSNRFNTIQAPDAKKELGDSIQRSKSRFQHLSRNLATERKMAKELQQLEKQWKEQPDLSFVEDDRNRFYTTTSRFSRIQPLPNMPVCDLIKLWAEEAENVGRHVLRDNRKMKETRKTYKNLAQLTNLGNRMYRRLNVGKAEFNQHWNSREMRYIQNSINRIELDLVKEMRHHARCYSENREEEVKLRERSFELYNEQRMERQERTLATLNLLKLHEKQAALSSY